MHCHKTGLGAQYAHPEPRSRAHCARSANVVGAAACTASWLRACRAHSQRRSRAQRAQVGHIAPRSWAHVATSFPCPAPGQVATSLPGRDLLDDQTRSRRQSHVATSLLPNQNNLGRDLKKWGRDPNFHTAGRTMSRHQIGVATPLRPI